MHKGRGKGGERATTTLGIVMQSVQEAHCHGQHEPVARINWALYFTDEPVTPAAAPKLQ